MDFTAIIKNLDAAGLNSINIYPFLCKSKPQAILTFDLGKNILYIIVILAQLGVILYFVRRSKKKASAPASEQPHPDTYIGRRSLALSISPEQLKLAIPPGELFIYGLVMDWNMGNDIATLVTYITGAANLYFSSGGSITGGGKNPDVGEAAVSFITAANHYFGKTMPVSHTAPPPAGCARFFLLTNHGIFAAQELVAYFDDGTSPWLPLFEKGNHVIMEMRGSGNGSMPH